MKEKLDDFFLGRNEPLKSTLLALKDIILSHHPQISITVKYGMPCFLYGKNILCYLWTDRKSGEPYILMAEGKKLTHPHLEQGSRSRMKILRIDPHADLPVVVIAAVLDEAIGLYGSGAVNYKG